MASHHNQSEKFFKPARLTGLGLIAFASLAIWAMSTTLEHAATQSSWVRTNCTIDHSALLSDEYGTDSLDLRYHYSVDGTPYQSTRYELPSNVSRSETYFKRELQRFVPGTDVECFYDPVAKGEAVLKKTTWGDAAFVIIPGIFLIIGLSLFLSGIGRRPQTFQEQMAERSGATSIEEERRSERSAGIGRIIFFSLFILAGLGATWLFFGTSWLELQAAKRYEPMQCTIISSEVSRSTSRDSKGNSSTSYSMNVIYEYTRDGRRFSGTTFSAAGDRFFTSDRLYEIVNQLGQGREVECFVDPADPTRAVLNRETPMRLYAGLLPLVFSIAGVLGLLSTGGGAQQQRRSSVTVGKRAASRVKGFITYCLITIVWNAIVGAVTYGIFFDSDGSVINWFPLLITIPFLLIGIALILGIPYSFLQIFNPTLDLELSGERIRAGSTFGIGWHLNGSASRVRELVIKLDPEWDSVPGGDEGEEEYDEDESEVMEDDDVSVSVGSETRATPSLKAAQNALAEMKRLRTIEFVKPYSTTNRQFIESGKAEFQIPDAEKMKQLGNTMPVRSWRVTVTLKIPWYPDSTEIHQIAAKS